MIGPHARRASGHWAGQEAGEIPARDRRCKRGGTRTAGHCGREARGKASADRSTREPEHGPTGYPCDASALKHPGGMSRRAPSAPMPLRRAEAHGLSERTARLEMDIPASIPRPSRFHSDRAVGGDRHHRRPDRPAAARRPGRARGRQADAMHQQPPADRPGHARLSRHGRHLPGRGLDRGLRPAGDGEHELRMVGLGPAVGRAEGVVRRPELLSEVQHGGEFDGRPHGPVGLPLPVRAEEELLERRAGRPVRVGRRRLRGDVRRARAEQPDRQRTARRGG